MAGLNTVDTVTVRGMSEGLDKVASDLGRVDAAQQKVVQSGDSVARVTDTTTRRQLSAQKAYERTKMTVDNAWAATMKMVEAQNRINRAFEQGIIDAQRYAADMELVQAKYAPLAAANTNLSHQTGNVAAQFQDIAVQLAGGQSPFLIALQQGTQLSGALGANGARGAIAALGAGLMSLLNPISLATIALIGLGGVAYQYLSTAGDDVESLDDKLKRHADLIASVKSAYGEAIKGAEEYAHKSGRVLEFQLRGQIAALTTELQNAAREVERSVSTSVPAYTDIATGVGFGGADLQVRHEYEAFNDVISRLREQMAQGRPDFQAFQAAVEEIGRAAAEAGNKKLEELARGLINATDGGLKLQGALQEAEGAITAMGNAASHNAGKLAAFDEAVRKLRNIAPIRLSDREQVEKYYQEMVSAADTEVGRQAAERERREALDRIKRDEDLQEAERKRREAEALARRGSRSAQADEDAFGRAITTAQGRTRQLEEETRLIGVYGGEVEAARLRIELETAAKKRGLDLSDDMQRAIETEVQARRAAVQQLEDLRQRQEELNRTTEYFGSIATDALSDLLIEGRSLEDVFSNVAKAIANAAMQAALMGSGPLAGLFGMSGSNGQMGGLFGALFKGLTGSFGGGSSFQGFDIGDVTMPSGFSGYYDTGGSIPSGRWGIVGERRPEVVMGPATVVPKFHLAENDNRGGGKESPVQVTYAPTIDARGSSLTEAQIAALLAQNNRALREALPRMIADARSRTQLR